MSEPKTIRIFDTTLRDGEQSPGASMNIEEKLRIAHQLEKLNVDVMEAGFPIASEGDFEAVKKIAQTIRGPQIAGLSPGQRQGHRPRLGSAEVSPANGGGSTPSSPPATSTCSTSSR